MGRPFGYRKDPATGKIGPIDPDTVPLEMDVSEEPPRKRKSRREVDFSGLEELLYTIHLWLAALTSVSVIELSREEAQKLAQAAKQVARHYDVPGLSQKTVDICHLIIVIFSVYGPKAVAFYATKPKPSTEAEAAEGQEESAHGQGGATSFVSVP